MIDNLIIGSGPAALAAAMALRRHKRSFEVIDAGFDLEPQRKAKSAAMARVPPGEWKAEDVAGLFPPPVASADGVEQRLSFGSDFPYRKPAQISIAADNCKIDISHGFGGFGNVWGAAVLPYADHDLSGWPVDVAELRASYRNLSAYMKLSGADDDLRGPFPMEPDALGTLQQSEQADRLGNFLRGKKEKLSAAGILCGRARVAVNSSNDANTCRYCGYCLDGCVYGAIFNPDLCWDELQREGFAIHKRVYAVEFQEENGHVRLRAVNLADGSPLSFTAKRLFLGLGTIASTRLVARSLRIVDRPIMLKDSQYFFFPLLSLRKARDITTRFTLAELFVEILNPAISPHFIHFQVYGINNIFKDALRKMLPGFLRARAITSAIERRFYLFQGFLHSSDSGCLVMHLDSSNGDNDRVSIRGINNPKSVSVARNAQRLLRRALLPFGLVPPFYLKTVPLGRSFHVGGSFPMGGAQTPFHSDLMGRPAGLKRTHLVDASTFPAIPATTITYTSMANSDRIVSLTVKSLGERGPEG